MIITHTAVPHVMVTNFDDSDSDDDESDYGEYVETPLQHERRMERACDFFTSRLVTEMRHFEDMMNDPQACMAIVRSSPEAITRFNYLRSSVCRNFRLLRTADLSKMQDDMRNAIVCRLATYQLQVIRLMRQCVARFKRMKTRVILSSRDQAFKDSARRSYSRIIVVLESSIQTLQEPSI